MELILQGGDVWEVIDPSSEGVPKLTTPGQTLDDWTQKDKKALTQIKCYNSNTTLLSLWDKLNSCDTWRALPDHYNSVRAQDTSIITSKLHHFKMDDLRLLEPQINTMQELQHQLASLGGEIPDSNFAMAISKALSPSYNTLKTIAVANITDTSALTTKTLVAQILHEEKWKLHQSGVTMMLAKSSKPSCQHLQSPSASKSNTTKSSAHQCTNPKCGRPGHTFKQCWAEGGGNEGWWFRWPQNRGAPSSGASKESVKVVTSLDMKQEMLIAYANSLSHALLTDGQMHPLEWIVNSSATSHLCGNWDWFTSYQPLNPPCKIILGDKHSILAPGISQIEVTLESSQPIIIHNILYCPKITHNLLSVPQLTSIGAHACFVDKACQIYNPSKKLIAIAELKDGLYRLPVTAVTTENAYITIISKPDSANVTHSITASASLDVWHACLGHISMDSILKMLHSGMVKGMDVMGPKSILGLTYCPECEASSHHRNPIPSETHTHSN